ncbi:hypothetical protein SLNHY_0177 [Streptomyces albus]|nr:hypothetical protein SLNHY_0177 [Streptomyces albus]
MAAAAKDDQVHHDVPGVFCTVGLQRPLIVPDNPASALSITSWIRPPGAGTVPAAVCFGAGSGRPQRAISTAVAATATLKAARAREARRAPPEASR